MLKVVVAAVLIFEKNAKIRYSWGLILLKWQKWGTTGFFSIENAEIRYCCGFILFKVIQYDTYKVFFLFLNAKAGYGWGFDLFKMLK